MPQLDLEQAVYLLLALVVALTVHEAAHAWLAYRLGDPTAKLAGRLTLNPLAHLDPLGTLMMVYTALIGFGLGWAKPVPVNPYYLRTGAHRGMALVSLGGPAANLLLATGLALLLRAVPAQYLSVFDPLISLAEGIVFINVIIAIFNLIPVPPLDGFNVLLGLLPLGAASSLARIEPYGPLILLALIFFGFGVVRAILSTFANPILRVLLG